MERERRQKLIDDIIESYKNTPEEKRSLTKLHKEFGIKRQTLAKYIKAKGLEVTNYQSSIKLDPYVFDSIDTEEKAYWLGFLFADGNISSKEDKLEINLSIKDIAHLEKFKLFLKAKNRIRIQNNQSNNICRFSVRNKHLWKTLYEKGCIPNKSLVLQFPNLHIFKNRVLVKDFIRGYCDGDGSLGIYKSGNNKRTSISFVGTKQFLQRIEQVLGISGYIRNKSYSEHNNKAFDLKYSNLKARKVARILYENSSVHLDRKYKIFENFGRIEEESSKVKSSKIGEDWNVDTEVI